LSGSKSGKRAEDGERTLSLSDVYFAGAGDCVVFAGAFVKKSFKKEGKIYEDRKK